jgi:hypothetical protein
LEVQDVANPTSGDRFDSPKRAFRVTYLGTSLAACFGETLSRLRPAPELVALVGDEWRELGFMEVGSVAASWRHERVAVRAWPDTQRYRRRDAAFVDIESIDTHQILRAALASTIGDLGYRDLDVGLVRGPDRRVTRAISQWVWEQADENSFALYAGLRYLSRLDSDWECWAIFDDVPLTEKERKAITLDIPELGAVAEQFGLLVF